MAPSDYPRLARSTAMRKLSDTTAAGAVAAMIGVLFAGSTLVTPLYVIYKHAFGFSQITLTLIYAAYVVGNLAALLWFGRFSDQVGRRRTALAAIAVAIVGAIVFLFADGTPSLYAGRILTGLANGIGVGTGTAWLAELIAEKEKSRATVLATGTNFVGIGVGALVGGLLAQYAPWPLRLPFVIYLLALVLVAAPMFLARETVRQPAHSITQVSMRPRVAVPAEIRAQFVAPAVTGFGALALVGFYAALAPSLLAHRLHVTSHAIAGAILLELGLVVAVTIVATRSLASRIAMLSALALMLPSVALLVLAQLKASMILVIVATAVCGAAAGLGYRGSLQVVNQIAPESQRAEVVSSYFVCCFLGNALPVIGIGIISTFAGSTAASLAFAGMIVAFAVAALCFGMRYLPR